MEADGRHPCPAPGCEARVERDRYACRADWSRLPLAYRHAINVAWRHGTATEHQAAMAAAGGWYRRNPREQ